MESVYRIPDDKKGEFSKQVNLNAIFFLFL